MKFDAPDGEEPLGWGAEMVGDPEFITGNAIELLAADAPPCRCWDGVVAGDPVLVAGFYAAYRRTCPRHRDT